MTCLVYGLILCTLIISSLGLVVLTPSSGAVTVCWGEVKTYTCMATGPTLFWGYADKSVPFSRLFTATSHRLHPFTARFISSCSNETWSSATVNVTHDINRTTLHCRDALSISGSDTHIEYITFNVQDTLPVRSTFISVVPTRSTSNSSQFLINVSWSNATCAPMYHLSIRNEGGLIVQKITTQSTNFTFTVPEQDYYTISVNSIDYFGRNVGDPESTKVCLTLYNFTVRTFITHNPNTLSFVIENTPVCQLQILSCEITVTEEGSTSYNETNSCFLGKVFDFTGIISGMTYNYTINITSNIGSVIKKDTVTITKPVVLIKEAVQIAIYSASVWSIVLFLISILWCLCGMLRKCRLGDLDCWDYGFWSFFFCDCFSKDKGEKND